MIKKRSMLLVLFTMTCFAFLAAGPAKHHLPVRAFKEKKPFAALKKDELNLLIDGSPKTIEELITKEKSIGRFTGLGRHFVLSFLMMEYGKKFESGISYFITEILRPEDTLFIFSPLQKTYPVAFHPNKEKMLREIAGILRKDCYFYSEKRLVAEKKLLFSVRNAHRLMTYPFRNQGFFLGIINFFENFPSEFSEFKTQYLLPDIEKYRQAVESLSTNKGEGQRWWIHFQEHSIDTVLLRVKNFYYAVDRFFSYAGISPIYRTSVKKKLREFDKQLTEPGSFSGAQLLEIFLRGDIDYNIIFTGGKKSTDPGLMNTVTATLEGMLEEISTHSGGMTGRASKFDGGLIRIKDHVDRYYELVCDIDGGQEANHFRVELDEKRDDIRLVYNDLCMESEPPPASGDSSQEKVKIAAFSREESIIRFTIGSFKIKENNQKGKPFGLLKVAVLLLTQDGEEVYLRQNTLRASKDQLDITLSLPLDRSGNFKLSINVTDIIGNNRTSFQRDVTL